MDGNLAPEVKESLHGRWEPMYRSQLHYLVMWGTRSRRPVLRDRHIRALQLLIKQVCDERGYALREAVASSDHVHVLIGLRPTQSVASVVREIKGRCGMALLTQFPELRVWLRGNLVWDERYAVETVSAMRVERVRDRLRRYTRRPNSPRQADEGSPRFRFSASASRSVGSVGIFLAEWTEAALARPTRGEHGCC